MPRKFPTAFVAGIVYVMRYATWVKADPGYSVVADQRESNIAYFLKGAAEGVPLPEFTQVRGIILALFGFSLSVAALVTDTPAGAGATG